MPTGDAADIAARMRAVLPRRWAADASPMLQAVLLGLGTGWAIVAAQITALRAQLRIATATGDMLDIISPDFFGAGGLLRLAGESDAAYSARIRREITRERVTRAGLSAAIADLIGQAPTLFEAWNTGDTGGWDTGAMGWDTAGRWGSLDYPAQVFVDVPPQINAGIPNMQGWTGDGDYSAAIGGYDAGAFAYIDEAPPAGVVTDGDIYAAINRTVAAGVTAWTRIDS